MSSLGEATAEPVLLREAILTYQAVLTVRSHADFPNEWATAQHNLAIAYVRNAKFTKDFNQLDLARTASESALTQWPSEIVPYLWAVSHGGLGKVALARFDLAGDKAQLPIAARHLTEARAVFALDPENIFARECDDYLAQIDMKSNP